MLNCHSCGLTNRPYATACTHCERPLQDAEAAAEKQREWDALTPALREELEKNFDRMREGTLDHLQWLRRHRLTHAATGAILVSLTVNGATLFQGHWSMPVDTALGAGAGLLLNRWHGGAWHGAGLFMAAGIAALVCKLPFLGRVNIAEGGWFVACFVFFILACLGYVLGLKLDFEHADRSVIR
jgi:hypothetical protein